MKDLLALTCFSKRQRPVRLHGLPGPYRSRALEVICGDITEVQMTLLVLEWPLAQQPASPSHASRATGALGLEFNPSYALPRLAVLLSDF